MIQSHRGDWVPGGRYGTQDKYAEGYRKTFGDRGIFKNLAPEKLEGKKEETDEG